MNDERDSLTPFWILVTESNDQRVALWDELPDVFDDPQQAAAQARIENDKWGVGAVVFQCMPIMRLPGKEVADGED
jgi:hypothetical protein